MKGPETVSKERTKQDRLEKSLVHEAEVNAERTRFEAQMNGEKPKLKFRNVWYNALEDPPFGTGKLSWGFGVMLPFRITQEKQKELQEKIQDVWLQMVKA